MRLFAYRPSTDRGRGVNPIILPGSYLSEPALSLPLRLWLREGGRCHWCRRLMDMGNRRPRNPRAATCDHVQPRALGGTDEPGNLAGACKRCNQLKGAIDAEAFRTFVDRRLGELPEPGKPGWTDTVRSLALFAAWRK
jgi:hypothetical protein